MADRPVATAGKRNGNVLQEAFTVRGSAGWVRQGELMIAVPLAAGAVHCPPPLSSALPAEG